MYVNPRGLSNLLRRRPGFLRLTLSNIKGRLIHQLRNGTGDRWVHPPEQITLVVTDLCNLRCKMCQYAFSDAPGYRLNQAGRMDSALFYKLMEEVTGQPVISLTGGEPLLHPQIAEFVACIKRYGRFSTLTTNGWFLAERAAELCEAGLDVLIVSMDGPLEVHNRIRGRRSFERLEAGLAAILDIPDRPVVFISMAISDLNFDQLTQIYELAEAWGVDGVNFNHIWIQTAEMVDANNAVWGGLFSADEVAWEIQPEAVDPAVVADSLEEIRNKNRSSRLLVTQTPFLNRAEIADWYRAPDRLVKYQSTRCAWTRMKIWPDGSVKPCRDWQTGTIAQSHVMEIWEGQKFGEFRQILAAQKMLPICARCCYIAHR